MATLSAPDQPAAVAVDLGSESTRIWVSGRGAAIAPTSLDDLFGPGRPVRRGCITDREGAVAPLRQLLARYPAPLPPRRVVVACRPVLATPVEAAAYRDVLAAVFTPVRLLFVDTVRAAATGAGTGPGPVIVADVGAQVTEVALLADGHVSACRAPIGTRDVGSRAADTLAWTVARLAGDLCRHPTSRRLAAAELRRGLLLVGDGAARPQVAAGTAAALGAMVRPVAGPYTAALRGAAIAALAARRHPAITTTTAA